MVSGLLSIDLVILLTWQFSDPLQRRLESFPLEDPLSSNDDIKIRPELEHCESENNSVWLGKRNIKLQIFFLRFMASVLHHKFHGVHRYFFPSNKYFRLNFIYDSQYRCGWKS